MTRRSFARAAAGLSTAAATATTAAAAQPATPAAARVILELRHFYLRNTPDNQLGRASAFLERVWMPALERAGAQPAGFFASLIAPGAPFVISLASYASASALGAALDKLDQDDEYRKGLESAYAQGPLYARMETWLLRAFESVPRIELPPAPTPAAAARRAPRIFEMRMYESSDMSTLKRKVGMFNSGEIAVFRKLGMAPVFFGEMIAGPRMPNLVYMLGFESLAAREQAWSAFGSDPDWVKMRATPGLADAEIVSNISNSILRPLPFSRIR